MQTLKVSERSLDWVVEHDGELVFSAPDEERCFEYALAASSQLFEDGIRTEVILQRLS